MGNLLGDFVKGKPWDDRFEPVIWEAIMEHRHIDVFTDEHPAWKASRDLLDPELRRYAGIIIDVFYDHFLSRNWKQFCSGQSVGEFTKEVYADLERAADHAPKDAMEIIRQMIAEDWFANYRSVNGIEYTLKRISRRSENLSPIDGSVRELKNHFQSMEEHFLQFFPDALRFMEDFRRDRKK